MLTIPKDILDTLHTLRATQLARPYVNEFAFAVNNPVVILTLGLGDEIYLGLDGRVFIVEWMNEVAGVEETQDVRKAAGGLVIAARNERLPELLRLVPARPPGASVCGHCQGRGWIGEEANWRWNLCVCFGLGWVPEAQ